MLKLWADFNEADGEEIWTSLRRTPSFFLDNSPEYGERVLLWDHEGNRCEAIVEKLEHPIVFLKLDESTWFPASLERKPHVFFPVYVPEERRSTGLNYRGEVLSKVS